jgi:hypothetical protein
MLLRYQLVLSADFTSQFVRSRPMDVDSWWLTRVYEDPEELKRKMIELAIQQRPYLEQVLLMEQLANGTLPGLGHGSIPDADADGSVGNGSIAARSADGSLIASIDDIDSFTQRSL